MSDIPHQVSDFISKSAPFDVLDEDKVSAIATKPKSFISLLRINKR